MESQHALLQSTLAKEREQHQEKVSLTKKFKYFRPRLYTCQLYCSKRESAAAKKVVNNWFTIIFTILFIYYIKIFQY